MPVTHVVMLKFKDDVHPKEVQAVVKKMLDLKNECLHPSNAKPYIISTKGGRENSIEKSANGLTHIFVTEFKNVEDRTYYVRTDPAHLIFMQGSRAIIDKMQVVDFAAGVW